MKVDLRLYGLLDADALGRAALPALADAAARGRVTLLQYRDKTGDTRTMVETARAILAALQGRVPLLINDRVDVALAAGAQGAHLGRDDMAPADARVLLGPGAILGITLKDEADLAGLDPARVDYGCIGGVFATASKDNPDPPIGLDGLARLVAAGRGADLPLGAIAGIDATNAAACIGAGADGVAIISALFRQPDPEAAARDLRARIDSALAARGGAA